MNQAKVSTMNLPDELIEHLSAQFNHKSTDFGLGPSKLAEMEENVKSVTKTETRGGKKVNGKGRKTVKKGSGGKSKSKSAGASKKGKQKSKSSETKKRKKQSDDKKKERKKE